MKKTKKKPGTPDAKFKDVAIPGKQAVNKTMQKVAKYYKKLPAKAYILEAKPAKKVVNKLSNPFERVVKTLPATKGKWVIYAYHNPKAKKQTTYKIGDKTFTGFFEFGNRLISRNGKVNTGNKGFNSVRIAENNIKVVKASA